MNFIGCYNKDLNTNMLKERVMMTMMMVKLPLLIETYLVSNIKLSTGQAVF
jgi:hypothetical protein